MKTSFRYGKSATFLARALLGLSLSGLVSACGGFSSSNSSASVVEDNHIDATSNITDFSGITCNGVAVDTGGLTAALAKIGTTRTELDIPCPLVIDANFVFPENLTLSFYGRGSIKAKAGTETVAINGNLRSGRAKIFNGFAAGNVTFGTTAKVLAVFPEWFGAVGNNTIPVDDQIPLDSAFKSLASGIGQHVSLAGKTYSASSCDFTLPGHATGLIGAGSAVSTIYCRSGVASSIVKVIGAGAGTPAESHFVEHVGLVADTLVGSQVGLMLQYASDFRGYDILAKNNETGFMISGVADSECDRCQVLYSLGGMPAQVYGFFVNGADASSFVTIENSSVVSNPASFGNMYGAYINGDHIADLTFENFRTEAVQIGAYVKSVTGDDGDISFVNSIHSGFRANAYKIEDVFRMISILGGWLAPANTGGLPQTKSIEMTNAVGTISGIQFFGSPNSADHENIKLAFCENVVISGNQFRDGYVNVHDSNSTLVSIVGNTFQNGIAANGNKHVYFEGTQKSLVANNALSGFINAGTDPTAIYLDAASAGNKVIGNVMDASHFADDTEDASGGANTITP